MSIVSVYFNDSRERVKRRKSSWSWILLPLSSISILCINFLIIKCLLIFQKHLIPADVIFYGQPRIGGLLIFVPTIFISLPLGFLFANFAAWCIPPARNAFEQEAKCTKGASFKETTKFLFISSIIIFIIIAPLCFIGIDNYFYVTKHGVAINPLFSLREKHYKWSDVVKIRTQCLIEGRNLHLNYILQMKDGIKIDLLNDTRFKFLYAYKKIKLFLASQRNIIYDYETAKCIEWISFFYDDENAREFNKIIRNED